MRSSSFSSGIQRGKQYNGMNTTRWSQQNKQAVTRFGEKFNWENVKMLSQFDCCKIKWLQCLLRDETHVPSSHQSHQTYHVFFNGFYLLCHPVLEEGVPPAPLRDFDDEKGQHWEAVPPRTKPHHPRYSWPGHPVCLVNSFVLILIWYFLLVYISSWWMLERKGLNV